MTEEKKKIIEGLLADHVKWMKDSNTGKFLLVNDDLLKRYDLSGRDLKWANLNFASMVEANLE